MVLTGLERIARGHRESVLRGRAALLTNQSGVTSTFASAAQVLSGYPGLELSLLFAPEHGLFGQAQDQVLMEERRDPLSGLPVVSLYGRLRKPDPSHLAGIDVVVVDIQDVGSRYYTFSASMALVMEAARTAGIPVVVLDRPNPLGGETVEGNIVAEAFRSFVGPFPISVRHGMTLAELASLYNSHFGIGAALAVVPMERWERHLFWEETDLPWIPPSPNMPLPDTALVYPGTCLLEGTNLSEGRGTTRPFEVMGAPFIDPNELCRLLTGFSLPGVTFRPVFFEPTYHKWAGEKCGGLWLHVTGERIFKPFLTGIALLMAVHRLYADRFMWKDPPYEGEERLMPIDMLAGSDAVRQAVEEGKDISEIENSWAPELAAFMKVRENHLIY